MVLANGEINIIADMEGTTGVKLHNNRQKLRARFDILRKLGQGTYGKVQLAVNKDTGEEVAIKTIKKSKIETEQDLIRIQREIQIMSSVQHPHIIHIYEVFENKEKIVLVMEYASGGELYDYLSFKKVLAEPEARRVFRQVASAVFYCHKNMICHRDLKLENILLDERGNAKIADFGLSNVFDERNFLSTFCGSPLYASPEIVRGTPYYGPEVDCWSLGVLLYTLVYGAMPFDGSNFKRLVKQISEGDYYEPRAPSEASGLIRKMLTVDPAKRATVDDICCDRWVDLGEFVPLLDTAEELCKRMPVRLDYLLALTSAPPPEDVENTKNAVTPKGEAANQQQSAHIGEKIEHAEDDEDADQWERPALQALTASATHVDDSLQRKIPDSCAMNGDASKKHKLLSSASLTDSFSSAELQRKKKKRNDDGQPAENCNDDDEDGGAEKISTARPEATITDLSTEPMDAESVVDPHALVAPVAVNASKTDSETKPVEGSSEFVTPCDDITAADSQLVAVPDADVKLEKEKPQASEGDTTSSEVAQQTTDEQSAAPTSETGASSLLEQKQTTDKGLAKRRTLSTKKPASTSSSGLSNGVGKTKKSGAELISSDNGAASKAVATSASTTTVSKVPKLRKSLSVSKDNGTSAPVNEAQTPPSAGTEKRKLIFPAVRVSDAKKSFENKQSDKKPLGLPGMRVSSAKNTFESQSSTPESASPSAKPLTKSATTTTNGTASKGSIVKSASLSRNEIANQKQTEIPSDQSKQPSRGIPRVPSPTKCVRDGKSAPPSASEQGGHHHRGCIPHEAKTTAAQEAKKSPPKSLGFKRRSPPSTTPSDALVRKNSLSKVGSPSVKLAGKEKEATSSVSAARRPSSGGVTVNRTGSTFGSRPRSPVKSFKGKATDTTVAQPPSLPRKPETEVAKSEPSHDIASEEPAVDSELSSVTNDQEATEKLTPEVTTVAEVALQDECHLQPADTVLSKNEKRGSIEIAPLPENALVRRYSDESEDQNELGGGGPVVRFVPKDKSGLVLLGVKSEVLFDVAAGEPSASVQSEAGPETVIAESGESNKKVEEKTEENEEDSKIIRYIATVRRHGSTDDQIDAGPERVTLLDLRCSASGDVSSKATTKAGIPETLDLGLPSDESGKPSFSTTVSPTSPRNVEEQFSKIEDECTATGVGPEQRGYNVYRSKYRSIQKYRSVVERHQDEEGGTSEKQHVSEMATTFSEGRTPSVERSDSFSSTGSTDDLEDVFESLTSESLFTSLLSRTRNLIDRLTEGDAHTTRWFKTSLLGRSVGGGSIPSSFVFNSPGISFRLSPGSSSRPSATYRISASTGPSSHSLRHRSNIGGDYESEATNYASDTGSSASSRRSPRWRYSRSMNRGGDEDDDIAFMSDTGGSGSSSHLHSNIDFRSRSSYSNFNSNRSVSVSSSTSLKANENLSANRQSRYDTFRSQEPLSGISTRPRREEARSDVISALLRHRNRSLDTHRPHSFYEPESHASDWSSSSSTKAAASPSSSRFSQPCVPEVEKEQVSSLYGTVRRPSRVQRYSKSVTKELSEEYDSEESGLNRPRSVLVLSDPKDEAVPAAAGSSVSVSRDYSRNVSCTGSTQREEEEEYEREHHVTEEGGRVTTRRRECKRSISQTQDSSGCCNASSVMDSSEANDGVQKAAVNQPVKKQGSIDEDHLSRQDSGVGSSMYESTPSTPTSAGVQSRKGYLKYAHSVSNELESLQEEINKIGLDRHRVDGQSNGSESGENSEATTRCCRTSSDNCQADGTITPPSDSAETGSVCSDTASTDALNSAYQHQKAGSEEESVGERIRRKSFFARFNESRIPSRKGRKSGSSVSGTSPSTSMRSDLGRTSSLRHHPHFYDDEPTFTGGSRTFFEPSVEFYSPSLNRTVGGNQRWSMHLGGGSGGPPNSGFSDSDFLYSAGDAPASTSSSTPRRRSSGNGNPDVLSFLRRNATDVPPGEDCCESGMMYRTHSLPEEPSPALRPVFRQHSMPGSKSNSGNSGDGVPSTSHRRPSRLGLHTRNYPSATSCEETGETSCTSPTDAPSTRHWRSSCLASPPSGRSRRTSANSSGFLDPLEAWDAVHTRSRPSFASLMDSLESPSEVLQKAMDLCDSLRFS